MKAEDYNKQFADERVDHIGQPPSSHPVKEVWRRIGFDAETGRTTQISNKGKYRTVDTHALLNGGNLKPKIMNVEMDLYTRNLYFPNEEEKL